MSPLEQFALAVLEESRDELADLDGGWLQDRAEELGLLVHVRVTEPCGELICRCVEYYLPEEWPVECLRYSEHVKKCLQERKVKPSQQIEVTLPDSCSASEAQKLIDQHTVAQLKAKAE